MTNEQLFEREGAYTFGNRLIYKNQDVGVLAPGCALVLTAAGEEIAKNLRGITDVEPKEVKPTRAKPTKPAQPEPPAVQRASDLDDIDPDNL